MAVKIACVVFDCSDALTVGRFWSAAIDRPLDPEADSSFASIGFHGRRDKEGWGPVERDADPSWLFARVPEPKMVKNRQHLDVIAVDVEAEIARLVQLGATRIEYKNEFGYTWTLMADPEGNEFDIGKAH
jgi:Glyoxalase-like domain